MAFSLIAGTDVEVQSPDNNGITTSPVDTSGADLIVLALSAYIGINTPTVSDNKSNTYSPLTASDLGAPYFIRTQIWYCAAPTVGTGHTFSLPTAATYGCLFASAWSGSTASPFDQESGGTATAGSTVQPGSITPTENDELLIAAITNNGNVRDPSSINGGFTITGHFADVFGVAVGGGLGYLIQTSAAAANPTWTLTGSADSLVAAIASFKAAAGGGGNPWCAYAQQ